MSETSSAASGGAPGRMAGAGMPALKGKRLLVVGAGGFIGGFIAARGLAAGMDVTVAVRQSTSRRFLGDERLRFLVLDYDSPRALKDAMADFVSAQGNPPRWDYIIYNLGATKAVNYLDFKRVNYDYLRSFTEALKDLRLYPDRFLYMSSLSALGPGDEQGYAPLTDDMAPAPNTRYGQSKIMAEQFVEHMSGLPYIIFRPTGVYGPHERDYLMMIKSIDAHFDFAVGFRRQELTFIYVDDLVDAMFAALASGVTGRKYIISEGRSYTQREFRSIVARELGRKWVLPVKLPLWAVYAASYVAEKVGRMRLKASTLNRDKYLIMKQRNWNADTSHAWEDFGFVARVDLREGIRRTVKAYRDGKKK